MYLHSHHPLFVLFINRHRSRKAMRNVRKQVCSRLSAEDNLGYERVSDTVSFDVTQDPKAMPIGAIRNILLEADESELYVSRQFVDDLTQELIRRRRIGGEVGSSATELLHEFLAKHLPDVSFPVNEFGEYDLTEPAKLTPSPNGRECLGNGSWPGYACVCDECPYALACYDEADYL